MGYGFIDSDPAIKSIFTKNNKKFMKNGVMCFCDEDVKIENIIKNSKDKKFTSSQKFQ